MALRRRARIVDVDGVTGHLRGVDAKDPRHPLAVVQLAKGTHVQVPFDLLEHHADGGYSLPARWSDFAAVREKAATIPIIEERVKVTVREAPRTRVRARRRVVTESRLVEVPIRRERVEVEHVPVNQFVERAPAPRYDGDTLVVPVLEEVPVIQMRLRVREELRIRVHRERHVHRETVQLRRHELELDRATSRSRSTHEESEGDES